MAKKKRWLTIVGEHVPAVSPAEEAELRPYWLEATPLDGIAAAQELAAAERERLLYERGVGPQKPDGKPEPQARVYHAGGEPPTEQEPRPLPRKPRLWTGQPTDGAEV